MFLKYASKKTCISLTLLIISNSYAEQWYRGNTHAHTKLCGHADSSPETVAKWYLDHKYNFLILSEHNKFIDPKLVSLPKDRRKDFILIPGEEITGKKVIHTTAMNINGIVPWNYNSISKSDIIQNHINGVIAAKGQAILNHPNFHYAISAKDILPTKNLHFFELYNGHPKVNNFGDHQHSSTESIWDQLLSAGKLIYAVSSDDAHHFKKSSPHLSNSGRGWIMVRAQELNPDAITKAMLKGDFYASNGVFLKTYTKNSDTYFIEADNHKTKEIISSSQVAGNYKNGDESGYKIEFIGNNGKVLKAIKESKASYKIAGSDSYIRVKITFSRKLQTGGHEEFYAWGQPIYPKQN